MAIICLVACTSISPSDLTPGQAYNVLVACVQPRPIGFVSTISNAGVRNLAPFSFFNLGGANPPSLLYSASLDAKGEEKDSLRFARESGEFVVNIVDRAMADGMNATSYAYPPDFDEWEVSGFTPIASDLVRPQRVLESPAQFECRLHQVVEHGSGPSAARYVVGEIVRMHVRSDVWDGENLHLERLRPIARLGGSEYLDTGSMEIFTLKRPSGSLERRTVEE